MLVRGPKEILAGAKEIRTQYTLGYYSHLPTVDGRYRTLDVHVERPNLDVIASRLGASCVACYVPAEGCRTK